MMSEFRHVIGRFFFYFLREQFHKVALEGNAKSTVDSLRMPLFMDFQFTVPPLPEQASIAAYLDLETAKLDALVGKVEEAVERLQEYRTALITAAVTGKIDVRQAAP
jgi:type I restriction enzyme S subunit